MQKTGLLSSRSHEACRLPIVRDDKERQRGSELKKPAARVIAEQFSAPVVLANRLELAPPALVGRAEEVGPMLHRAGQEPSPEGVRAVILKPGRLEAALHDQVDRILEEQRVVIFEVDHEAALGISTAARSPTLQAVRRADDEIALAAFWRFANVGFLPNSSVTT